MDFFGARHLWGEGEGCGVFGCGRSVRVGNFGDRFERGIGDERGGGARRVGEGREEARSGAGFHQRDAGAFAYEVVDEGLLAETDFGFCGMDVDVDFMGRHFEEEQDDGERGGRDDVAVGLNDGMNDEAVADEALVDEDVDGIAVKFLERGARDKARDAEEAGVGGSVVLIAAPGRGLGDARMVEAAFGGYGQELVEGVAAEDLIDALGRFADRRRGEQGVGSGVQLEVDFRMGERVMRN
jgi:hypothetical protein